MLTQLMMRNEMLFLVVDYSCHQRLAALVCYSGFRSSATIVLRCYGPESDFICVSYLAWGFNFTTKTTVNLFFNDRLSRDTVRKDSITRFKKCQRTK